MFVTTSINHSFRDIWRKGGKNTKLALSDIMKQLKQKSRSHKTFAR